MGELIALYFQPEGDVPTWSCASGFRQELVFWVTRPDGPIKGTGKAEGSIYAPWEVSTQNGSRRGFNALSKST